MVDKSVITGLSLLNLMKQSIEKIGEAGDNLSPLEHCHEYRNVKRFDIFSNEL